MILAWAALGGPAFAGNEIGTERMVGIGGEVGNGTYANVSAKVWTGEMGGVALRAGTLFVYHEIGARYEGNFVKGQWFDWADLPIWWWVGADVGFYSNAGYSAVQVGPAGGVGAALQFTDFPGEAFITSGVGVYPLNYCNGLGNGVGALCVVQPRGTAGFRYYF